MKQPTFNGRELLPLSVMEAAHAGDAMAMERVLRYYEGYINKLCTRTLYDSNGIPYVCVDEYMKRRLEIKLIHAIVVALRVTARPRKRKSSLLLPFHVSADPLAAGVHLDKNARKRTAAHHRAKRTHSVCAEPGGWMRQEAFPYGKSGATNTAPQSKCGSLRATTHRRAILPYSHSPSVKSVAGDG